MLFVVDPESKSAQPIHSATFADLKVRERYDLQEWVLATPQILGEELMVLTTEFSGFDRTSERLDVLALDTRGKLVVVELKRSAVGTHAELQALRYAAYCSTLTLEDAADLYAEYLGSRGEPGVARDEALERIRAFVPDPAFTALDDRPRLILAAEEFPPEITATVLWLRGYDLDVSCVRLRPHMIGDRLVIDSTVLIPLPEAERFIIRRERKEAGKAATLRARSSSITIEDYTSRLAEPVRPLFSVMRGFLSGRADTSERAWQSGVSYRRASDRTWVTWLEATTTELRVAIPPEAQNTRLAGIRMFGTWPVVALRDRADVDEAIRLLTPDYEPRYRAIGSPETVSDYYVSVGEGPHRTWEDSAKYGFVSAGGGQWYTRSLQQLKPGTRIFAYVPKTGYVGVGTVVNAAVPVTQFRVNLDGREVPILEAPLAAPRMDEYASDPERMEYVVRVDWIRTLPTSQAIAERGMFANQNSACRLTDHNTLEILKQRFELPE
jgi:hypothetical protein